MKIIRDGKLWFIVDDRGKNANGDKAFFTYDEAKAMLLTLPPVVARPVQHLNDTSYGVSERKSSQRKSSK